MPLKDFKNVGEVMRSVLLEGVITSVHSEDDTADVDVTFPAAYGGGEMSFSRVPIFYHCHHEATLSENGSLSGAASAFQEEDRVLVHIHPDTREAVRVLSFVEGKRPCVVPGYLCTCDDPEMPGVVFVVANKETLEPTSLIKTDLVNPWRSCGMLHFEQSQEYIGPEIPSCMPNFPWSNAKWRDIRETGTIKNPDGTVLESGIQETVFDPMTLYSTGCGNNSAFVQTAASFPYLYHGHCYEDGEGAKQHIYIFSEKSGITVTGTAGCQNLMWLLDQEQTTTYMQIPGLGRVELGRLQEDTLSCMRGQGEGYDETEGYQLLSGRIRRYPTGDILYELLYWTVPQRVMIIRYGYTHVEKQINVARERLYSEKTFQLDINGVTRTFTYYGEPDEFVER